MGLENFGKYIWSNFSNPIYESVARLRKFAPQRRKERKEEKKKEEKQILLQKQHLLSGFCLSLRSLRLCGARIFYSATPSYRTGPGRGPSYRARMTPANNTIAI
jgi:hypothetical protein